MMNNITTQIRPLFLKNLDVPPKHAVVMHDLRLDYRDGEEDCSVNLCLDLRQIRILQRVLKAANSRRK